MGNASPVTQQKKKTNFLLFKVMTASIWIVGFHLPQQDITGLGFPALQHAMETVQQFDF